MKRVHRLITVFVLLAGLLVFSGCVGDTHEEVWVGEHWKIKMTINLTSDEVDYVGDLSDKLEEIEQEAKDEDASFKWKQEENEDGSVTYIIEVSGRGLDNLNDEAFGGTADLYKDDDGTIHISWVPSDMASTFRQYSLTIYGGEILSSNADTTTKNSASWQQLGPYDSVEVVLKEKGGFSAVLGLLCVGALVLIALAGGIGFFITMQRKKGGAMASAASGDVQADPFIPPTPSDAWSSGDDDDDSPVSGWRSLDE